MRQSSHHQKWIRVFIPFFFLTVACLSVRLISGQGSRLTPKVSMCSHRETSHQTMDNPKSQKGSKTPVEKWGQMKPTKLSCHFQRKWNIYPWVGVEKMEMGKKPGSVKTKKSPTKKISWQMTVFTRCFHILVNSAFHCLFMQYICPWSQSLPSIQTLNKELHNLSLAWVMMCYDWWLDL